MNQEDIHLKSQIEKDIQHLHRLGYAQELYRSISGFSNFAITFSVISVLSGLMMLYGYGLKLVGPFSIWTWGVVGFFQLILALALGEIASIYPLAGGVYKWTGRLSNPHVGWFCGCFSLIGWLACTAGIEFGLGIFLTSYLGFNPNNVQIVMLITVLIVLLHSLINIFGIRIVAWFNDLSVNLHIIGVVVLVVLLLIFGQRNSVSSIFHTGGLSSGNLYFNFSQALLMSAWTLTAFDAAANVSEESINPSKVVPWGMIFAVLSSLLLGSLLLFSLNLALPDLRETLDSEMPAALYVIKSALGSTIYRFVTFFVLLAQFTAGLSSQTVLIRILYAFSRDGGIPFSSVWKYVSPKHDTPIYSVFLASTCTIILCSMASYLQVITSLSTMGIYFSYVITLGAAHFNRRKMESNRGPFYLGRMSRVVQTISLIWALFVTAIMVIPPIGQNGLVFLASIGVVTTGYLLVMRKKLSLE
ncbi:MAG: amino acid permease [Dehalobacterium sp.]